MRHQIGTLAELLHPDAKDGCFAEELKTVAPNLNARLARAFDGEIELGNSAGEKSQKHGQHEQPQEKALAPAKKRVKHHRQTCHERQESAARIREVEPEQKHSKNRQS